MKKFGNSVAPVNIDGCRMTKNENSKYEALHQQLFYIFSTLIGLIEPLGSF